MPTLYRCDMCGAITENLGGWFVISVLFIRYDPTVPTPPGGRMHDGTAPDLLFDKAECRDSWCTTAGLVAITQAPATNAPATPPAANA